MKIEGKKAHTAHEKWAIGGKGGLVSWTRLHIAHPGWEDLTLAEMGRQVGQNCHGQKIEQKDGREMATTFASNIDSKRVKNEVLT